MNDQELRTYAVRGLMARLAELDDERVRILELLGEWDTAPVQDTRRKARNATRHGTRVVDATPTPVAAESRPAATPELEVARVLPRRHRVKPQPAPEPILVLPPMPRLVKARAS